MGNIEAMIAALIELLKSMAESPFWSFISGVVVVLFTQQLIARRERRKKIRETQLQLYLSTVKPLFDLYEAALQPKESDDHVAIHRKMIEMAARYSIMGSGPVIDAFGTFGEFAMKHIRKNEPPEEKELRQLASEVTYAMCCDIHGEKNKQNESGSRPDCSTG